MSSAESIQSLKRLGQLQPPRENVFPSEGSIRWYIRQHRDALMSAGAMRKIGGQWFFHEQRFDAYVLGEPCERAS